jgi:heme exporter protein A
MRYVGHLDAIKPAFTVRQNLRFWARLLGGAGAAAAVDGALERVALSAIGDSAARLLSAGQKRRLSLARLLIAPAVLWLLDEPTTALDRAGVAMFAEIMAEHGLAGGLAMVATHVDLGLGAAEVLDLGRISA